MPIQEAYIIVAVSATDDIILDMLSVGFDEDVVLDELELLEEREELLATHYQQQYSNFIQPYMNNNPYPNDSQQPEASMEWEYKFNASFRAYFKSIGLPYRIETYEELCSRLENFQKLEYRYKTISILESKKSSRIN